MRLIQLFKYCIYTNVFMLFTSCHKNVLTVHGPSGVTPSISLINPKNALVTPHINQTFQWSDVNNINLYELKIASPYFDGYANIILDTTVTNTQINLIMRPGYYEWCVNTINISGVSAYSDTSKLTIH